MRLAVLGEDLVGHVGGRLHQVEIGFAFQPLLHDLHVQQAQEAAAEAEAQGVAGFGLELEAGSLMLSLVSASRSSSKSWPSEGYRPQNTIRFGSW